MLPALGIMIDRWNPTIHGISLVYSSNAAINICMAAPFFCVGTLLKEKKRQLNEFKSFKFQLMILVTSWVTVYLCGKYNGGVWMYINGYGQNIVLFFVGGIAGTVMTFVISKWLYSIHHKVITDISNGTIIILGFHFYLIDLTRKIEPSVSYVDPFAALIIVLVFIPVIWFVEKHIPYLMGIYRIHKLS